MVFHRSVWEPVCCHRNCTTLGGSHGAPFRPRGYNSSIESAVFHRLKSEGRGPLSCIRQIIIYHVSFLIFQLKKKNGRMKDVGRVVQAAGGGL